VLALPATRGDLLVLEHRELGFYTVLGHGTIRRLGRRAPPRRHAPRWLMLSPCRRPAVGATWRCSRGRGGAVLFSDRMLRPRLPVLVRRPAAVEASRVAALLYVEPLVTMAAAVVLLGEPVGATTVSEGSWCWWRGAGTDR